MRDIFRALPVLLALGLATAPAAADSGETFHAALTPPTSVALVDDVVEIALEVDSTATSFNGFTITLTYDPAIVDFESVVQGPLVDAACSTTFEDTVTTPGTITYTDIILCGGVSMEGPGVLCTFSFRALDLGQSDIEITSDPNCTFFDAGTCVGENHPDCPRPVSLGDAVILVQEKVTGAAETQAAPAVPALALAPNPTRAGGTFSFRLGGSGEVMLEIFDATGRRRVVRTTRAGPSGLLHWDGRDVHDAWLRPGVYFARMSRGDREVSSRVVVTR